MMKYKEVLTSLYQELIGSDIINLIISFTPIFIDPTEFISYERSDEERYHNKFGHNHSMSCDDTNKLGCIHSISCDDTNKCELRVNKYYIDDYDRYVKEIDIKNPPNQLPFGKISRKINHEYYWAKYLVIPNKKNYFNDDLPRVISKKPCQKEWGYIEMFCCHHNNVDVSSNCQHNMWTKTDEQKQQHKIKCAIQRNNTWLGYKYYTYETFKEAAWRVKEIHCKQRSGSMYGPEPKPEPVYGPEYTHGQNQIIKISDDDLETIINDDTIEKNNDVIIRKIVFKMCDSS